eukprot:gene8628-6059_t
MKALSRIERLSPPLFYFILLVLFSSLPPPLPALPGLLSPSSQHITCVGSMDFDTTEEVSWDLRTAPMLFCPQCENLLYPEGDDDRQIKWRCNACKTLVDQGYHDLVYAINIKMRNDTVQENDLLAEFASDPTAQRDSQKKVPHVRTV